MGAQDEGRGQEMTRRKLALVLTGAVLAGGLYAPSAMQASVTQVTANKNPPGGITWWYAKNPGPGSIVAVRRSGSTIQFVDNWVPCFTGQRIRRHVYKGGGQNQNAYYSKQMMKLWVSSGKLHAKRAFVQYEKLSDVSKGNYKRISATKANRLLGALGLSKKVYFKNC